MHRYIEYCMLLDASAHRQRTAGKRKKEGIPLIRGFLVPRLARTFCYVPLDSHRGSSMSQRRRERANP